MGLFQDARERVSREVDSIVQCLHQKRDGMFEEIGGLEREFEGRRGEQQKDISKLNTLIAHTEELGQNSLLGLRQEIIAKIQQEVQKLQVESSLPPEYRIDIEWGQRLTRDEFIERIHKSSIHANNNAIREISPIESLAHVQGPQDTILSRVSNNVIREHSPIQNYALESDLDSDD